MKEKEYIDFFKEYFNTKYVSCHSYNNHFNHFSDTNTNTNTDSNNCYYHITPYKNIPAYTQIYELDITQSQHFTHRSNLLHG